MEPVVSQNQDNDHESVEVQPSVNEVVVPPVTTLEVEPRVKEGHNGEEVHNGEERHNEEDDTDDETDDDETDDDMSSEYSDDSDVQYIDASDNPMYQIMSAFLESDGEERLNVCEAILQLKESVDRVAYNLERLALNTTQNQN